MKRSNLRRSASVAAIAGLAATLGLSLGAVNAEPAGAKAPTTATAQAKPAPGEKIDSFLLLTHHLTGWTPLDNKSVIVWPNPFQPYLIELAYPSPDLKFANAIGVTSFADRVYAGFDSVRVRGFRYPIRNIYKLTREEAKNLEHSARSNA